MNVFKIAAVNIIIMIGNYFLLNTLKVLKKEGINFR